MRRKPGSARQIDIADAILRVAGREGIGALTMERLGREVGITAGALFRHFPSRTAMLNRAAERAVALLETTFPPEGPPPLERLRQFVVARARLASEHVGIPQLVFSEQFGKALPPRGAQALRAVVFRTRDFLVTTLREAAARNQVRRDIPAPELALSVIGAILVRALFAALDDPGAIGASPTGDALWPAVLRQLAPPARTSSRLRKGTKP